MKRINMKRRYQIILYLYIILMSLCTVLHAAQDGDKSHSSSVAFESLFKLKEIICVFFEKYKSEDGFPVNLKFVHDIKQDLEYRQITENACAVQSRSLELEFHLKRQENIFTLEALLLSDNAKGKIRFFLSKWNQGMERAILAKEDLNAFFDALESQLQTKLKMKIGSDQFLQLRKVSDKSNNKNTKIIKKSNPLKKNVKSKKNRMDIENFEANLSFVERQSDIGDEICLSVKDISTGTAKVLNPYNIVELTLYSKKGIEDLSCLNGFTRKLKSLSIIIPNLKSLKGVENLNPDIDSVSIYSFVLTDCSALSKINCKQLELSGAAVPTLSMLSGKSIVEIWLNHVSVADRMFPVLNNLKKVEITAGNINNISGIQESPLNKVKLDGTDITDISVLNGKKSLKNVSLCLSPIKDFSPLKGLSLETLVVSVSPDCKNRESLIEQLNSIHITKQLIIGLVNGTSLTDEEKKLLKHIDKVKFIPQKDKETILEELKKKLKKNKDGLYEVDFF